MKKCISAYLLLRIHRKMKKAVGARLYSIANSMNHSTLKSVSL